MTRKRRHYSNSMSSQMPALATHTIGWTPEYKAMREREDMHMEIIKTHVCGVCGDYLALIMNKDTNEREATCTRRLGHKGLERKLTWTEKWLAGEPIPNHIAIHIDAKIKTRIERRLKNAKQTNGSD
jgi:hypothetical protein